TASSSSSSACSTDKPSSVESRSPRSALSANVSQFVRVSIMFPQPPSFSTKNRMEIHALRHYVPPFPPIRIPGHPDVFTVGTGSFRRKRLARMSANTIRLRHHRHFRQHAEDAHSPKMFDHS